MLCLICLNLLLQWIRSSHDLDNRTSCLTSETQSWKVWMGVGNYRNVLGSKYGLKDLMSPFSLQVRHLSNKMALFSKPHRLVYARLYPTVLVNSDGSSYTIRHHEPRKIIRLPLDLSTLSEAERKERIEKRKPKKKIVIEDELEDSFNANKYLKFIQKKK